MLRIVAGLIALLIASPVFGQGSVLQGGGWSPGRIPMYVGTGSGQAVVQDSGPAGGGASGVGIKELLLTARGTGTPPFVAQGTGPGGTNFCNFDAPTTNAAGYHYLCMSPNATVAGLTGTIISAGSGGATSPIPLYICSNGTCFSPGGGIAGMTVGVTTIASGTSNGILYNNAGLLGNTNSLANAVLATNGSGVPSLTTSIPSGVVGNALSWFIVGSALYPTIQSAVDAADAAGSGIVWLPCGTYNIGTAANPATGVDARNTSSVRILGSDTHNGGSGQCAMVNYLGTGAAFQFGGSVGFEFGGLYLTGNTAATLFDGTTGAAVSTSFAYIHDNTLVGQAGVTVHIDSASGQQPVYKRNNFVNGSVGIRGITSGAGIPGGQYMVNADISLNSFQPSLSTAAIQGLETANVLGNVFQGQLVGYASGPAGTCHQVNWQGNWHGDAVTPQPLIQSNCALFNASSNLFVAGGGAAITQANTTGTVNSVSNDFIGSSPWVAIGTGNFLSLGGNGIAGTPVVTGTPTYSSIPVQAYFGSVTFGGAPTSAGLPLSVRSQGSGISPRAMQVEASDFGTNGGMLRINKDPGVSGAARIFSGGTATVDGIDIDSGLLTLGLTGTSLGQLVLRGGASGAITVQPQNAAGTFNFNLPTTAGASGSFLTSGGGGAAPMTWTAFTSACATWLVTPSSANLRSCMSDETGTGLLYFQNGDIGTPSAGVGTNLTALNATQLTTGTIPTARLATSGVPAQIGALATVTIQTFCPSGCTTTIAGGGSGTYTPTTGTVYAISECVGGGGGGGGVTGAASQIYGGGGGGSGSYCKKVSTAAAIGGSQTVSIGAGGAGGAGSNNGSAGGASSVGSLCTTNGGSGGNFSATGVQLGIGGAGGTVGSGDEVHPGNGGAGGSFNATASNIQIPSGIGGASRFGGAPISAAVGANQNGVAGQRGAGGSGAYTTSATGPTGGAGGAGYCVVTEFRNQ